MFLELKAADFERVRYMFSGQKQYLPVLAIINGNYPGRVFVDDIQKPKTALVWAIGRWAYIAGLDDYEIDGRSLAELIDRVIFPDSLQMNLNWFELYAQNTPIWMRRLDEWLRDFSSQRHFENTFIWDIRKFRQFRSGYIFPERLSLEMAELPILPPQILESPFVAEKFKARTAIGCRVMDGQKIVAVCRSNGFGAGDEFMIDVITYDRESRGKGYGTAATIGLLDYCLERELGPLWETTEDNIPSRRLAEKLGFVETETYPVYAIEF